jgi:hypothetical protein
MFTRKAKVETGSPPEVSTSVRLSDEHKDLIEQMRLEAARKARASRYYKTITISNRRVAAISAPSIADIMYAQGGKMEGELDPFLLISRVATIDDRAISPEDARNLTIHDFNDISNVINETDVRK